MVTAQDFDKGFEAYNAGDYQTALREWKPLAEQGDAYAQTNLGLMYSEGQGVSQDYGEAFKWYQLAADQGSAEGQRRIGEAYIMGYGVVQDFSEAFNWQLKSAKQGHAAAQHGVGMAYAGGHGVEQNKDLGYMWLTLSVDGFGADTEYATAATAWLTALSKTMTTAEVYQAQEMANTCAESGYIKCDETFDSNLQNPARDIIAETQSEAIGVDSLNDHANSDEAKLYEQDMAAGRDALADGNYTKAIKTFGFWAWIKGDAEAQTILGAIAAGGFGDVNNPDYAKAFENYTLAAEQNFAPAQLMLYTESSSTRLLTG